MLSFISSMQSIMSVINFKTNGESVTANRLSFDPKMIIKCIFRDRQCV